MDGELLNNLLSGKNEKTPAIEREVDVDIDEGTLLISDYNVLNLKTNKNLETTLEKRTRDNTQLLINNIWSLTTKCIDDIIVAELPKPKYVLPRSRKLPKPKALTKWQQFAKEKGINSKKKGRSKLKWDDLLQKWTPAYGFKKAQADMQKEWLVECKADGKPIEDPVAALKTSKSEKKAKNELQRLRNLAKAKKVKIPKVGLPSTEHFKDAKQLSTGAKVFILKTFLSQSIIMNLFVNKYRIYWKKISSRNNDIYELFIFQVAEVSTASLGRFTEVPKKQGVKGGKVTKKKKKTKKTGQMKESAAKTPKKPKGGKGNRDFRKKVGGRKRRT